MSVAIVTGASGLIGSEAVRFLHEKGFEVAGVDNNMRAYFFGDDGSTDWNARRLADALPDYRHLDLDIRGLDALEAVFRDYGTNVELVVHCAAQPSHDWAAREPVTDFSINATGTLNMLECTRRFCPAATFIFTSTNKVYGDRPNQLPLIEKDTRWSVDPSHPYAQFGIDESMSIDQCMHSVFGASKVAADILCQEYGRYFGLNTGVFRGGCLTGPAHSSAELHGFLAYLVRCQVTGRPYTIYGYKGKQVRDNIHSHDLIRAFWEFHRHPRPGEVYNIGGGARSNCSVIEAIAQVRELTGHELNVTHSDTARSGDHIWWISDTRKFETHYPEWQPEYDLQAILQDIVRAVQDRQEQI
jgi:CDP-paratose 2-epimerase